MSSRAASWSLPAHLFQVSGWSANCQTHDPASCVSTDAPKPDPPDGNPLRQKFPPNAPIYAWTDLTYLLHKNKVSWGYYVVAGNEPDCANDASISCGPVKQNARTRGIWNPLPYFDTVRDNNQLKNIQSVSNFYS